MSRVARAFAAAAGRPLVIPFVTAGFPAPEATPDIVEAMARAGADMIEIGMPFSDPLADGPTIQAASEQALAGGMNLRRVLEIVRDLRGRDALDDVPLILMGYSNPLYHYGLERFLRDAAAAGVDGFIVPDLPPEEGEEYRALCESLGLAAVFLMAPNTADARVRVVDESSTHFSYCVAVTGVTGARGDVAARTTGFLSRVRALARKPFVVGFGVRTPEHILELGPHADGVVVGSALIDAIRDAEDPAATAAELVHGLAAAARSLADAERRSSAAGQHADANE